MLMSKVGLTPKQETPRQTWITELVRLAINSINVAKTLDQKTLADTAQALRNDYLSLHGRFSVKEKSGSFKTGSMSLGSLRVDWKGTCDENRLGAQPLSQRERILVGCWKLLGPVVDLELDVRALVFDTLPIELENMYSVVHEIEKRLTVVEDEAVKA